MIDSLFKQASTLAGLNSGPLATQLPVLAKNLYEEQYPPETIRRYVRVADKFGRWLCRHGLSIAEADEAALARYRSCTGRRKNGQLRAAGRGLAKVLRLLRPQPAEGHPGHAAKTEGEELVGRFDSHLQHVAGLMPGTRSRYLRHATLLVKAVFGTEAFDVAKVTPQAIVDFVREQAAKLEPSACAARSTSIRVFLRFPVASHGLPASSPTSRSP
ncbi:MAG: site-specific integrase [Acidobacteria bacterium]|nr:site-specific integrase [Acidobacteriota bacterium]